ncbi:carnitine 3-dehydrogenase [Rhodosalinus halophilus]|uniref:L-carnitine dehydrogenase n=1 Tax=Rhodosalinus halophilus TaxID=2259333 RepID=A0A365U4X5_9RHOB|nr:carnitine 3-dehydrogenase [Rhodosalinus halophilus]RBI83232.1 carnitine 3-dehydrogenase [Rhodosalinus halophilus]
MTKTAAIIGAGVIGAGWAARFLLNGWDVRVFDPAPEATRTLEATLARARRTLPMLYDVALPLEGRLTLHDSAGAAVAGADWIQESVGERLELKHAVLREIEEAAAPETPIGSSTSGFTPSQLQQDARHPGRLFVAHPFNPVYLLPLVELVGSAKTDPQTLDSASETLSGLGMHPLPLRGEIDAHVADRLLEAVWRECLWLVKDGIATTEEIDDAIRMGFGLRWAQMGIFETYRLAGGEQGMRHFLAQFGPALKWPWTKLMDVPDLDAALVETIAAQSDAQSGHLSIADLAHRRDDNLVALLRALKARDQAAGRVLAAHEERLRPAPVAATPMQTQRRTVPVDWTDYNGHMNEGRYGQVFSDAAETVLAEIGAMGDYVARGFSYFTVETDIRYLAETLAGEAIFVESRVTQGAGKKLRLFHEMKRARDGALLATCDQLLIHVSLSARRACEPEPEVAQALARLAAAHAEAIA